MAEEVAQESSEVQELYLEIRSMVVTLADDPIVAGGIPYFHKALKNLRDMMDRLSGILSDTKRKSTNQVNMLGKLKLLYKSKKRLALLAQVPVETRGKSMDERWAMIEEQPELKDLEGRILKEGEMEAVYRTLVEVLENKAQDLKRANSDLRLQAQIMEAAKNSAGIPGATPGSWGREQGEKPKEKLGGEEVDMDSVGRDKK